MLITIPCMLMRGGTSKGPFFLASDLPEDAASRDQVLLSVMGSPDIRQFDGIGGGNTLTSKAIIVGASNRTGIDIEYLFAQVSITENAVDTGSNCGNMLSAVAPFAIERGLVAAVDPQTSVKIFNINTNKVIEVIVQTPGGRVTYDGAARVDGVPGTGAAVVLKFLDGAGAKIGQLLPTGNAIDRIDGVAVSCVDYTTPMVLIAAASVGKSGHESKAELDSDSVLLARLEQLRLKAALLMGMGDVSAQVLPKLALLSAPRAGGTIGSRYFVPWNAMLHMRRPVPPVLLPRAAYPGRLPLSSYRKSQVMNASSQSNIRQEKSRPACNWKKFTTAPYRSSVAPVSYVPQTAFLRTGFCTHTRTVV